MRQCRGRDLAVTRCRLLRRVVARLAKVIRIDVVWLTKVPLDNRYRPGSGGGRLRRGPVVHGT